LEETYMCINEDLEAAIQDRGVAYIPTVAEAIAEREDATAQHDRLIDSITLTIGRSVAVSLTDAATGILAAADREVMARLGVVMEAVLGGGRGQAFLTPTPEADLVLVVS
jgi:hypothetical protein